MTEAAKKIPWRKPLGNRYNYKPRAEMLSKDGLTVDKSVRITVARVPKKVVKSGIYPVHYNRDYVVDYFAYQLEYLKDLPWNEVSKIISESRKRAIELFKQSEDMGESGDGENLL